MARKQASTTVEKMLRILRLVNELSSDRLAAGSTDRPETEAVASSVEAAAGHAVDGDDAAGENNAAGEDGQGGPRPISLTRFAALLDLEPGEVRRLIQKINLGCGDSIPELYVDYRDTNEIIVPHAIGTALDRPLRLSPTEARGLLTAIESAGIDKSQELAKKIEGAFPPIDAARFAAVKNAANEGHLGPVIRTLAQAIDQKHIVCMSYRGTADAMPLERTVEPYALSYDAEEGTWYLSAFCLTAQGWRTFRLSRITDVRATDQKFDHTARPESAAQGLSAVDGAATATLAVYEAAAIADISSWRGLTPVERPSLLDRGRLVARATGPGGFIAQIPWAPGSPWLPRMIVQTFGAVEALRPQELRDEVRKEAQRLTDIMVRNHGTQSGKI